MRSIRQGIGAMTELFKFSLSVITRKLRKVRIQRRRCMDDKLHLDLAEVFLNSVIRFTSNHAMKVKGEITCMEVVVLIDNEATHNFISTQVVNHLGVKLVDTGYYGVMMSTKKVERGQGICRVVLTIHGIQVREDFLPLELGSTNVILGMKWLQTLRETKDNWGALMMKLMVDGRKMVIRGDVGLSKAMVSLKTMVRSLQEMGEDYLVGLHKLDMIKMEEGGDVSLSVQPLIQQFGKNFQPHQGWPPPQKHEYISTLRIRWIFGRGVLLDRSRWDRLAGETTPLFASCGDRASRKLCGSQIGKFFRGIKREI
ncbi:uncharacterized protein LOC114580335 [Dendrobium catenatum]|uniref:uncharacterized protein LOC114580335 n=1 Tax=Dendrobium catenatum TaxID=906689 RepID=UPI00109F3C73|nr:uncharacterized protein LOC114580335 [Dendrobium catenatum]